MRTAESGNNENRGNSGNNENRGNSGNNENRGNSGNNENRGNSGNNENRKAATTEPRKQAGTRRRIDNWLQGPHRTRGLTNTRGTSSRRSIRSERWLGFGGNLIDIRVHGLMVSGAPHRTQSGIQQKPFCGRQTDGEARAGGTALCYVPVVEPTEQAYRAFQRQVDRVCTLIQFERPACEMHLHAVMPFESARIALRSEAKRLFPDKAQLYEIIYESRFRRLWEQFCKQGGDSR